MLKSMYSGVSGMRGFQTKLDVIGNNIANVNTVGFKKSTVMFKDLLSQNMGGDSVNTTQVGLGSSLSSINTIHTSGSPITTGNQTDLSFQGEGYFVVGSGDNEYLTRSASFQVQVEENEGGESSGKLVTTQGQEVLAIPEGGTIDTPGVPIDDISRIINVDGNGVLTYVSSETNEVATATLKTGTVQNAAGLEKIGGSLYRLTGKSGGLQDIPEASRIISGQLEMSNVDLTEEFTEMILAQRGFQANSRVITTSDEMLQEIVNLKR
ncbi:flagellar hook-basal body complex protein [Pseudalkalibacillus hwajinpoensis]|uniref:Flagellar hook protein FlgE n=1 Tax=Guptibacillus hwajinpoensis TaxID=208199 RepID=A0A4U1MJ99_9BACL|nr:flagellar hook-basal body complex protein [Pseudalkalibacillus hwajinpoensis]TKD70552.1 flagellar hook-basal body complex protein [Pseudalkalibacillus hwajinpoensis]